MLRSDHVQMKYVNRYIYLLHSGYIGSKQAIVTIHGQQMGMFLVEVVQSVENMIFASVVSGRNNPSYTAGAFFPPVTINVTGISCIGGQSLNTQRPLKMSKVSVAQLTCQKQKPRLSATPAPLVDSGQQYNARWTCVG